jgi:hypothetical protein
VIARHRPLAATRPVDEMIAKDVLPRVSELTDAVDRLLKPPLSHARGRR